MFRKRRVPLALLGTMAALSLLATGACAAKATASKPAAASSAVGAPKLDPDSFSHSTAITNPWFPLAPGTQFAYEGRADRGHGIRPHRIVSTVTDLVKVVDGVRTVVIWDRDINAGTLVESELAFHAQDNSGQVWNLGEYPETYENGKFAGAPDTWISGVDRARGGILMLANPRVGTPSYVQGYSPTIDFFDKAKVSKTGQRVCVPLGCHANVLVIDEWGPLDPEGGHQLKYYAPKVGTIRIGAVGGQQQEFLVLTKVTHLDATATAQARDEALKLERRAYRVSKVYRHTPPAHRRTQP